MMVIIWSKYILNHLSADKREKIKLKFDFIGTLK